MDQSQHHSLDSDNLIAIITEFMECAVHNVLYIRRIYPVILFDKRMMYGISIWHNRHPHIQEYITRVIQNSLPFVNLNMLESYIISTSFNSNPLDQIVFKISSLNPTNPVSSAASVVHSSSSISRGESEARKTQTEMDGALSAQFLFSLENELRSILLKILLFDVTLPKLVVPLTQHEIHNGDAGLGSLNWSLKIALKEFTSSEIENVRPLVASEDWLVEGSGSGSDETGDDECDTATMTHTIQSQQQQQQQQQRRKLLIPISSFKSRMNPYAPGGGDFSLSVNVVQLLSNSGFR